MKPPTPPENLLPPFAGNINFNAQHSPAGAFMSFTCGHFGTGGGIGVEIGRPANQNLFVGLKRGPRAAKSPLTCLPFFRPATPTTPQPADFEVEQSSSHASPDTARIVPFPTSQLNRHYGHATDTWTAPNLSFSLYTPFSPLPDPATDPDGLRDALLPAVLATLRIDNRDGAEPLTAFFAIDFPAAGTRLLSTDSDPASTSPARPPRLGFAWRRSMGVLATLEDSDAADDDLFSFQRWSLIDGLEDPNPTHALGNCAGVGVEVPPGQSRTILLSIGAYLDGVVTTGLEGSYYYTRFYTSLEHALSLALDRADSLRKRAATLDRKLLNSHLSPDQQFLVSHATRSYYGSTQLLDVGGEPFWVVNEGEYCMMNTLDLSVDHAFWELEHNPWVVRNLLDNFSRHYSFTDQLKHATPPTPSPRGVVASATTPPTPRHPELPPRHSERSEESQPSDHQSPSSAESHPSGLASSRNSPFPSPVPPREPPLLSPSLGTPGEGRGEGSAPHPSDNPTAPPSARAAGVPPAPPLHPSSLIPHPFLPGGISFTHDMGVNNNFSSKGTSSYELPNLTGCFSHMTQEQLCNWVLLAGCYVASTRDLAWGRTNAHLLRACLHSLHARRGQTPGDFMRLDSARCGPHGSEITTYDSLDESLGQARNNLYIAVKRYASYASLRLIDDLASLGGDLSHAASQEMLAFANRIQSLSPRSTPGQSAGSGSDRSAAPDSSTPHFPTSPLPHFPFLPAVFESHNPGYHSRILAACEALIYPWYFLSCGHPVDFSSPEYAPILATLRNHTLTLLLDPDRRNLFPDGGIKLSSTSNNSWMSKIALFQHVSRTVLHLTTDPSIRRLFALADAAHVRWQTDGSSYWACSDQIVSGTAAASRYYPRVITAALWLTEPTPIEPSPKPHRPAQTSYKF